MKKREGLEARCGECHRNLFEVSRPVVDVRSGQVVHRSWEWTPGSIEVKARPGVHIRRDTKKAGERAVTYTVKCPGGVHGCSRNYSVRAESLWRVWQERRAGEQRSVILLGIDV